MSNQVNFPAEVQLTVRDAIQSNLGNKLPASKCIELAGNVQDYGVKYVQTLGGDSIGGAARNGIWPREFTKEVGDHYKDNAPAITPTALYRSVFGLSLTPQSLSSHRNAMQMLAEDGGVKELQNFHSGNDVNLMAFVPKLAGEFGMTAMAGICVQYNPNTMDKLQTILDQHYRDIDALLEQGHEGIYFKCASGVMADIGSDRKVSTEFTEALIYGARQRFGNDQKIGGHFHDTYGLAIEANLAAIRANEGKGRIIVDVLPPGLAGGTAQADILMLMHALKHSDEPLLKASVPQGLNIDAMRNDALAQYLIRGAFSGSEMRYEKGSNAKAFANRVAGGAVGILKADSGTRQYLKMHLGTDEWEKQQDALLDVMPEVFKKLGYPNIVTPNQHMVISAAKQGMPSQQKGEDVFKLLHPTVISYVSGEWGRVSDDVDPALKARVIKEYGQRTALTADELPDSIEKARTQLHDAGIESATQDEAYVVSLLGAETLKTSNSPARKLIEAHRSGASIQPALPELPQNMKEGQPLHNVAPQIFAMAYTALTLQKLETGFYKGVEKPELRAAELREEIESHKESLVSILKEQGLQKQLLGRALTHVNRNVVEISHKLGVGKDYISGFDLDFRSVTKSDLVQVFGENSVKSAAQFIVSGQDEKVSNEFGRVNSSIQTSDLLHMQKLSAVELFNTMLADSVKGVARVSGVTVPHRIPELKLTDLRDEVDLDEVDDQFLAMQEVNPV